jgi:hypothetical protein
MAATPKQSTELMSYFAQQCPKAPKFNRAMAKWAARELIESYGMDDAKLAIRWYATVARSQDWNHFVRVADSCLKEAKLHDQDITNRRKYRSIANEWRKS